MRYTKSNWVPIMIALSLVLSACTLGQEPEPTPDVGAIFTAAAETVSAQFSLELTQTALVVPTATQTPTNTLVPTFAIEGASSPTPLATTGIGTQPTQSILLPTLATATPLAGLATQAGPVCMAAAFIADVTYPDGTVVKGGDWIAKVWSIQNTGTCTWDDGFSLQPVTGDAMNGEAWVIDEKTIKKVEPNEIVEIRVDMKVPKKPGEHGGCWRMEGDNDYYFGTFLCVLIMVE